MTYEIMDAFAAVLSPTMLLLVALGALLGTLLGATPGISATLSIALLVPVTFNMPPVAALVFLGAVYCGAIYGASISAILINVPGTPSAVATMLDGYALTQQGKAGTALGAAVTGSFIGGQVGVFVLLLGAPLVAAWALNIGSQEFFWIVIFAMTSVGALGAGSVIKGLAAAALGLVLGTVGTHPISGTLRFTFGSSALYEGIPIVVGLVGLFSISQVMKLANDSGEQQGKRISEVGSLLPGVKAAWKHKLTSVRSAVLGTFVGTLPGAGADIASFIGYNEAKRTAKDPSSFGKGNVEGVLASETANNGVVGGSLIPMMTLGIPGNAVTAALLGGLLIHGLIPGPRLFESSPDILYPFIISLFLANLAFLIFAFTGLRYVARIILIPSSILAPLIASLTMVGAWTFRSSITDLWLALGLGIFGYILTVARFPLPPVVLGIILGPLAEENFGRAMQIATARDMSVISYFASSPISLVFIALTVLSIGVTVRREIVQVKTGKSTYGEFDKS
ncbi:tripartite tricarboxylate transporter permease [Salinicola peritrichatus]|uniref:tripartite tricarboxylate transporter permease n=1 Tax=Salinicola peritrichatus TaxID=1267424 RepID=UPI000DA18384|nr:tripartite tricarboxylate transporter permease [Salinicola peritrichatus]